MFNMKIKVIILFVLVNINVYSQEDTLTKYYLCINGYTNYNSSINATSYVKKMLNGIGIQDANFVLIPCRCTDNVVAVVYKGLRYILYDDLFIRDLSDLTDKKYYFNLFVFAHEIGHHLNGHTLLPKESIEISQKHELEADEFAGFMVAKAGGRREDIIQIVNAIPHPIDNYSTHPILERRLKYALKGFDNYKIDMSYHDKNIIQKYQKEYEDKIKQHYIKQITEQYDNFQYAKNISKAKIEIIDYKLNGDKQHVFNAIKYYKLATAIKEDLVTIFDLANLYQEIGNYENAQLYFNQAYILTKDPTYLLLYLDLNQQRGITRIDNQEFINVIENISYNQIRNYNAARALSRYYFERDAKSINADDTALAIEIMRYIENDSLYIYPQDTDMSKMNLADIYSDLTIYYNALKNYDTSYSYILKAMNLYEEVKSEGRLAKVTGDNYQVVLINKALIEVYLSKWNEALETTNILIELDKHTLDVYYCRGRAYSGLGDHKNAIKEYSLAIKMNPSDISLYYYRGLSLCKQAETFNKGIIDLYTACSGGYEKACQILDNIK